MQLVYSIVGECVDSDRARVSRLGWLAWFWCAEQLWISSTLASLWYEMPVDRTGPTRVNKTRLRQTVVRGPVCQIMWLRRRSCVFRSWIAAGCAICQFYFYRLTTSIKAWLHTMTQLIFFGGKTFLILRGNPKHTMWFFCCKRDSLSYMGWTDCFCIVIYLMMFCYCDFPSSWIKMEHTSCREDRIHHALDRCLHGLSPGPSAMHSGNGRLGYDKLLFPIVNSKVKEVEGEGVQELTICGYYRAVWLRR